MEPSAGQPAQTAVTESSANSATLEQTVMPAAPSPESAASAEPTTTQAATDTTAAEALPEELYTPLLLQLQDFLAVGGPVVWILLTFSVFALCIILVKLLQFALLRPESTGDLRRGLEAWRRGETRSALVALNTRRPVSAITALAMRGVLETETDEANLKEELTRVATGHMNQLRAWLRPLEVIATLSPLLGLLGTVLGMITAFQQMEAAGNQVDPSVLSGGIWQALLTTAVGLAVAIPVVAVHGWLERKVERIGLLMNDAVTRVFTTASAATTTAGALRRAA